MPLRRPIAALAGRTAGSLSRLTRRGGGTAVSGLVTSTLDPNFVPGTLRQLHSTVTVTGTNGKTTTTAALCALARAAGQRVLTNPTGSNLERGLAAALLPHVGWNGQVRHASQLRAVLELDEWAFAALAPAIRPRVAVFLNLFRDQLDRYGEVDRTAAAWQDAIDRLDSKRNRRRQRRRSSRSRRGPPPPRTAAVLRRRCLRRPDLARRLGRRPPLSHL